MSPVYLVSCVAQKASTPQPARDLYISDWFLKARAYVESTGCRWFILSALYNFLPPETVIPPYNLVLEYHDGNDRIRQQTWSKITADLAAKRLFHGTPLVIFAGQAYRQFLVPELKGKGFPVEVPLLGMGIGQQKKWFIQNRRTAA